MQGFGWVAANWVEILNAVGVVGGLIFTAVALHSDTKTRRIANLLTVTTNHREIWREFYRQPELGRVLNPVVDLRKQAVSPAEDEFVNFVILHLSSVYYATKDGIVVTMEGLRRDMQLFFSLPIPKAVWEKTKQFQNEEFVMFVEDSLKGHSLKS